jgi:hypothetical protein
VGALLGFVAPAHPQSREVNGQAGFLGEWELTATVTERIASGTKELVGPLNFKHVGITQWMALRRKRESCGCGFPTGPCNSDIAD